MLHFDVFLPAAKQRDNVVAGVCLYVCAYVCLYVCNTITFEDLNVESSFLVCGYISGNTRQVCI